MHAEGSAPDPRQDRRRRRPRRRLRRPQTHGRALHARARRRAPRSRLDPDRILWLSGAEPGRNRLGSVDTMRRYIYIHGCPDEVDIATPGSHGCIRMRNDDVIDLFDRVEAGTRVVIGP